MDKKARRILPPGIQEDITFGIMWIRIGPLKLVRLTKPDNNVLVQFWGEQTPAVLLSKSNTLNKNQGNTLQQYEIKCPITLFRDYLMDMKNNLKFEVESVGKVNFDITKFVKNKVQLTDKQVFEHFKQSFDILGSHHRKVGSLEVQMSVNFNPQIALRQLQQEEQQNQSQEKSKQILRTPADRLLYTASQKQRPSQSQYKNITSPDIDKNLAVDILAIENPQLLKQFYQQTIKIHNKPQLISQNNSPKVIQQDDRIPNSLNVNVNRQKFQPQKYLSSNQQNNSSKQYTQPANAQTPKIFVDDIKQNNSIFQVQQNRQSSGKIMQTFPTVQKILTYDNLKLNYYDQKQKVQKSEKQQNKTNPISPLNSKKSSTKSVQILSNKLSNGKDGNNSKLQKQFCQLSRQNQAQNKNFQKLSKQPHLQKNSTSKDQQLKLNKALQEDGLSQIQSKQKQDKNFLEEEQQSEQKQILSRVVNIDEELRKSQLKNESQKKIISPSKKQKIAKGSYEELQKIDKQFQFGQDGYQANKKQISMQRERQKVRQQMENLNAMQNSPNYRRTYQQNNFPQIDPITHHIDSPKYQTRMTNFAKPSSLIINLLIEIDTDSIKFVNNLSSKRQKLKFNIIHKPYGCKQRIKLGPNFSTNKITIMCPVSEELVRKMDKVPFIIQFWEAVNQKFIGIIKINLLKIKKGYLLQGRLNQTAIKTSILPTIIHRGQTNIENVSNAKSGNCLLYAAIGTSAQIQAYLNNNQFKNKLNVKNAQSYSPIQQMNNNPLSQLKKETNLSEQNNRCEQRQPQNIPNVYRQTNRPQQLLTQFLQYIDKNSHKYILNLAKLMKKQTVSVNQMMQFLKNIQISLSNSMQSPQQNNLSNCYMLAEILTLTQLNQKTIKSLDIKQSFNQFKHIKEQVMQNFIKFNYFIVNTVNENVFKQLIETSTLNIITKKNIQSNLRNHIQPQFLKQYLQYLNDDVGAELFSKSLFSSSINTHLQTFFQFLSLKKIIRRVFTNFYSAFIYKKINVQELFDSMFKKPLYNFQDFKKYFRQNLNDNQKSIWYWLCLTRNKPQSLNAANKNNRSVQSEKFIKNIKQQIAKTQKQEIILQKIRDFYSKQQQRIKFQHNKKNQIKIKKTQQQQKTVNLQNKQNSRILINRQQQGQNLIGNNNTQNQQKQSQKKQANNQNNFQINQSRQAKQILKETKNKHFQHSFQIKGVQLFLQFPFNGQCTISYQFPNQEYAINSKRIKLYDNKHRYSINQYGNHKFVIEGDITTYLNQIPIKFTLIDSSNKIFLEGALHPDELIINQVKQTKVVPLFNDDMQKMQGKIKIQCQYSCCQTTSQTIGKETVYNLFLPKSGFINFNFLTKIQQQKIRQQYRLNEQYYITLTFDLFHQQKNLKQYHPPISSKLYSTNDFEQQIQFCNSIKLSLNPVVLEYFKTKNSLLSLNIIYYSKQNGNYQKKQLTFATIKYPLLNLIKNDGIQGNFAFKNKYGMFMALCNSSIRYEKSQKDYSQSNSHINSRLINLGNTKDMKKANNFWIIIQFLQWINFENYQNQDQNNQISSIKFEIVMHGKKYQSSKINLSDQPFNSINSQTFTLCLTQEQFLSTKILPISIITNRKQKLAIDIDVKPISKKLLRQNERYTANSGYFLVVDQQSQLKKLRVGARIITFKGNSLLQNLVQSFSTNIDLDIASEMQLPKDLGNYNKMLDLFKANLKLSKRSFQDSLHMLLGSGGNQKRQKLKFQLMSSQILHKLDLTPLVCESQEDADRIGQQLSGVMSSKNLLQYIGQNQITITNLRDQILQRFTFKELDNKLDKNIQFLGLQKQVDVMIFVRKIKIYNNSQEQIQSAHQQFSGEDPKQLKITLIKGTNLHFLYNGIKPNVMIRFPQIGFQSTVKSRSGDPQFNQSFRQILKINSNQKNVYRKLKVEVYHVTVQNSQQILIGQGDANLSSQFINSALNQPKNYKIVLNSTMSAKMKAVLEIIVETSLAKLLNNNNSQLGYYQGDQNVEMQESMEDASKIQDMIKGVNRQLRGKQYMFQSSEDQY